MKNEDNGCVEKILKDYKKELQNLLKGDKTKSFDKITGEAIEKMKQEIQKTAEETTAEENKKKLKKQNVPTAEKQQG